MKNLCIALLLSAMVCTVGCKGESTEAGDDVKSTETAGGDADFDLATAELPDVLSADTPTAEVEEDVADEVCCQLGNIFKFLPTAECVAEEGVETTPDNCQVAPPDCTSDKDCDDGNVCTEDDCKNSVCDNTPLTGPACDDGDDCTENDACDDGACSGETKVECQPSICCFLDGLHAETTEAGCLEEGGAALPIDLCEDVCCEKNGELSVEMSVDCEVFGVVKDMADCEVVCCQQADWQLVMKPKGECGDDNVIDPMWCIGEVCCEVDLDPVMVPVDECKPPKGPALPPGECGDVCCLVGEEAQVKNPEECQQEGGQQFAEKACDLECCDVDGLYYEAPAVVCDQFGQMSEEDNCELLCCPWADGQFFYDTKANCPFAAAPEENCVNSPVCCDLGNGPEKMMADDCVVPKGSPLPAKDCGPICCKTDSEATVMLGDECEAKNGDIYKQELCDVICCLTTADASYGNLAMIQCDDVGAPVAEEHCEPVCCLDNTGAWLTTKGNCVAGNAQPPEQCAVVCCLDGESPGPKPATECQNAAPWSQCPGQCNEDADCGPPTCGADFEMTFGWSCIEQECQQVETACEAPQKCLAGQCTDTLEQEFGVNGTCNNNYATFKPGIEWETIQAIRLTVTYNTISCCATSGCGFYDSEVGPQPCGFPIHVSSSADQVDVDVSQHEGNVGDSYVLKMDGPSLGGKYTDTWCGDNYAYDGPWAEIKPSVTWFMVTAFHQTCCKLPNGQYGFENADDCSSPVSLAACNHAEVCCPSHAGPLATRPA